MNKKNRTSFSYNSWIIGTRDFENSQIALALSLVQFWENFQNHSYLLIKNCTWGRAISYTNDQVFSSANASTKL